MTDWRAPAWLVILLLYMALNQRDTGWRGLHKSLLLSVAAIGPLFFVDAIGTPDSLVLSTLVILGALVVGQSSADYLRGKMGYKKTWSKPSS